MDICRCNSCGVWRPKLAKHCSLCERCILDHDHHCGVMGATRRAACSKPHCTASLLHCLLHHLTRIGISAPDWHHSGNRDLHRPEQHAVLQWISAFCRPRVYDGVSGRPDGAMAVETFLHALQLSILQQGQTLQKSALSANLFPNLALHQSISVRSTDEVLYCQLN